MVTKMEEVEPPDRVSSYTISPVGVGGLDVGVIVGGIVGMLVGVGVNTTGVGVGVGVSVGSVLVGVGVFVGAGEPEDAGRMEMPPKAQWSRAPSVALR